MTALGIYMMVSLFMIVAALLEFAVVLIIKHGSQKTPQQAYRSETQKCSNKNDAESKTENHSKNNVESNNQNAAWIEKNEPLESERPIHERIDRVCFGLFPSLFVVFNAIYWSSYTIGKL